MATHAQFATVSPARARATFASKRRNGARPSRRSHLDFRARRRIVPPRPPRARELDADPDASPIHRRSLCSCHRHRQEAHRHRRGRRLCLELEIATDAVRMASTLCQEVQGQLMRQDEQAVTKDDKSLVTLADYAAQVRAPTVARIPSLVARALGRWSLFYSYSRH